MGVFASCLEEVADFFEGEGAHEEKADEAYCYGPDEAPDEPIRGAFCEVEEAAGEEGGNEEKGATKVFPGAGDGFF